MLEYDRIDLSERIDVNKSYGLCECIIYHYWHLLDLNFKLHTEVCMSWFNVAGYEF